jgi:DNA anti-recombination protein RmuC
MAQQKNKDLLSRLADRGEQVVGRITDLPGAKGLVDRTTALAKGLDDVQKRLRSLGPLEKRVASIEKRLDKLEGKSTAGKRPATRRTTSARTAAAKRTATPRRTTRRRPPGSSS